MDIMSEYDHKTIEQKWQKKWAESGLYKTENEISGKDNFYLLVEFPYPSGDLHVGHWYAFSVPDMLARALRMQGKNVLFPIGFDAFGLPAENAAIKRGLNPREWTYGNIETMEKQLHSMGASFDWSRKVVTCNPDYYRWTQWQFLQFFEKGLAYQKETQVNWCPSCKTVLANEQVTNGHCERCGTEVEKKEMLQWQLKITDYADRLLEGLEELDWPEQIKESQRNWIGKSEGAEIAFRVKDSDIEIPVFTTRPDTIFGATYMVLAPEHKAVARLAKMAENGAEVPRYQDISAKRSEIERTAEGKEKTGLELMGVKAVNPANGEEIPIFIADYVLAHYGTGAIMAVPAHDERDFAFAQKFNLPIKQVIEQPDGDAELPYAGGGALTNSDDFDGMDSEEAKTAITEAVGGALKCTYKLRDWVVSRQRYWGVPIPIIHCKDCGPVAVPEEQLPVELPDVEDYLPRDDGRSPLAKADEWVHVSCPKCGGEGERETDTFDTFVDSSWYFIRYADPQNEKVFADKKTQAQWLPVNLYSGGAEHTTMHVLYSRFWYKALFDLGLVNEQEPYTVRMNRGLILGPDGHKMSKSKGNVINPDEVVERLGADTVRLYLGFIGPYNEPGSYPWNPDGIVGVRRFVERVWRLQGALTDIASEETERVLHQTIKKVGDDMPTLKFNTAIAQMMILLNVAEKQGITKEQYETLITVLAPFAPHITEELWHMLGHETLIHNEKWPRYDESKLASETMTIAVQVNGKIRAQVTVPADASEKDVRVTALAEENTQKWLDGKEPKKVIYVPGRLINFVL